MKFSGSLSGLFALTLISGCASTGTNSAMNDEASRHVSARQAETTPYNTFQSKLAMEAGQTYLGFMRDEVKPAMDKFEDDLDKEEKKFPHQFKKWQDDWRADGVGVAVRIDRKNYFFNIGYRTGADTENDVKSGRSYGVGPTNKQSDPSDIAYLTELEDYLTHEKKDSKDFVSAIMNALANNDPSGWNDLSEDGQIVATDFMAIYTAEDARHIMAYTHGTKKIDKKGCGKHPWEIDLAAATFASVYQAEVGGDIKGWWAKGTVGSGIGETRRDRKALTQKITKALAKNADAKKAVADIESVVGDTGDDVIQSVFEYLAGCEGPDRLSGPEVKKLVNGMTTYMEAVKAHAGDVE